MSDAATQHFSTHREFETLLLDCIARSHLRLQMFDPDCAVWPLGNSEFDAALRTFLGGGGKIELAVHDSSHVAQHYPRFMRLLKDYGHAIECRVTGKNLRHLTDSFCVGDGKQLVRRFHSDHLRGEAVFDDAPSAQLSLERFGAIWIEADPGLHATTLGL